MCCHTISGHSHHQTNISTGNVLQKSVVWFGFVVFFLGTKRQREGGKKEREKSKLLGTNSLMASVPGSPLTTTAGGKKSSYSCLQDVSKAGSIALPIPFCTAFALMEKQTNNRKAVILLGSMVLALLESFPGRAADSH